MMRLTPLAELDRPVETRSEPLPLYTEHGGVRIGTDAWASLNYGYPLASLTISASELTISYSFSGITLSLEDVREIRIVQRLFFKGFHFIHDNPTMPKYILFLTLRPKRLAAALREYRFLKDTENKTFALWENNEKAK